MNKEMDKIEKDLSLRHDLNKGIVELMCSLDIDGANPFRLLKIQMEIQDILSDYINPKNNDTDKEILKKEKILLKILDFINKEVK